MTLGKLNLPSGGSNQRAKQFFDNVLVSVLRNKLQTAVSFNIDANGTLFTASNIRTYFNNILDALNYYNFVYSVIAYCDQHDARNDGMRWLRSQLKADDINNAINLKTLLAGLPIPPNMVELSMYLHQTFVGSELPGSSIIKVCPFSLNTDGTMNFTAMATALNNLNSDNTRAIANVLAKAVPSWIIGIDNFLSPSEEPIYCDNFKTIFSNIPLQIYSGSTLYRQPVVSSQSEEVKYVSWTNNLDGVAYSLFSIYDTTSGNNEWSPSLFQPIAYVKSDGTYTNRISWYNVGGIWFDAYDGVSMAIQRNETYGANKYVTGITWVNTPLGSQRCESVSINSITESCYNALTWLLSMDSIGTLKDNRVYGNKRKK